MTETNDGAAEDGPVGALTATFMLTANLSLQLSGTFKLSDFLTLGGNWQPTLSVSGNVNQQIVGAPIPPRSYKRLMWKTHYHENRWLSSHYVQSGFDADYLQVVDEAKGALSYLYWSAPIGLDDAGLG